MKINGKELHATQERVTILLLTEAEEQALTDILDFHWDDPNDLPYDRKAYESLLKKVKGD